MEDSDGAVRYAQCCCRSTHVSSPLVLSDVLAHPHGYQHRAQSSQLACTHSFVSFAKSSAPPRCQKAGSLNPNNFPASLQSLYVRTFVWMHIVTAQLLKGKEVSGTLLLQELIKSNQQSALCSFIRAVLLALVAGPRQGVLIQSPDSLQ